MRGWLMQRLAHPKLQSFWDRMLTLALRGLNIGGGRSPASSGELRVINSLPAGATVFDVGANRGQYARMALTARPDLVVHSFEPSSSAFADLRKVPRVTAYNFGFGEGTATVALYADTPGSGLGSVYPRSVPGLPFEETETVELRRIDDFCAEASIEEIDLLKIDAEGHELAVLRGMGDMRPTRIQFEFGGSSIDSRTYLRDFVDALPDYTIHRILPRGLQVLRYDERMEQFSTTNFLAVRAEQGGDERT